MPKTNSNRLARTVFVAALMAGAGCRAIAAEPHAMHAAPQDLPGGACHGPELACAKSATPLLLPDNTLLVAWTAGGHVSVARSLDLGHSFGPAVMVNQVAATVDNGPDARPKIAWEKQGRLAIAFSIFKDRNWNAQVLIAESTNNGESFSLPHPITGDPASQRFEALEALPNGDLLAAWIDKRGAAAAKQTGRDYAGAALAVAVSKNAGATFGEARIVQDNSCECCRLGVASTPDGQAAILFRNIYDGAVRDHAVVTLGGDGSPGPVYRVSTDGYRIDGCPHHGPSLAISGAGTYHAAWFTNGSVRKGLFYARSTTGGRDFSDPILVAGTDRQAARPFVLAANDKVWLTWKEFDGERTTVLVRQSGNDGASWTEPVAVASTAGESDHPLLIDDGHRTYLSWMTQDEKYRLIPIGPSS